ncbi:MAG: hypothetical protein QF741_01595 [Candidatus Peribacteraceae bacterium]|jgi:glutamate 5-kinase|nr:hypothetical protein [Candidatus Peribacteraceae bacterium]MDP7454523.1 hypothetical protein [Candidatus Peribacteraceae bacterium]MDP7645891.1 hypothetical protein [Candidatus Peribacteraceae bacterium]HJO62166.1 hypothetical protein [Desulfobacterales bacterium]|tara:strand:- start:575 stop:1351 length:777 start_codon:yes stop_codon:yes gene_type:complete
MESDNEIIVIKVGTDTVTENSHLNGVVMARIAKQISELREQGKRVILVSSGAVGAGRSLLPDGVDEGVNDMKQGLSSIGQTMLMDEWMHHFRRHKIMCAQGLVKEGDFENGEGTENMQRALEEIHAIETATKQAIVPIVNGNDFVTHGAIDYDNDHIAGLIAETVGATRVVFLTDVDGLYDRDPEEEQAQLIREVHAGVDDWSKYIVQKGESDNHMGSKCEVSERLAIAGVDVNIGNGSVENAIHQLLNHEIGTRFYV